MIGPAPRRHSLPIILARLANPLEAPLPVDAGVTSLEAAYPPAGTFESAGAFGTAGAVEFAETVEPAEAIDTAVSTGSTGPGWPRATAYWGPSPLLAGLGALLGSGGARHPRARLATHRRAASSHAQPRTKRAAL